MTEQSQPQEEQEGGVCGPLIARYRKLKQAKAQIEAQAKTHKATLQDEIDTIEKELRNHMKVVGTKSLNTPMGKAVLKSASKTSVDNWDEALAYILETKNYSLLEKRINKTEALDVMTITKKLIPGVGFESYETITVEAPAKPKEPAKGKAAQEALKNG